VGNLCIFVDAGYLFKQGSSAALHAKLGRHDLLFNALDFMVALRAWLRQCYPEDELLRTYWYDGAKQGVPTPDQLDVASLAFVKLRLGRINSAGQQKGVDTLMVRDLMVLSQERSIQRAVVLSGDEDLREGIEYAQDRGVRVALVGIDAGGDRSQSVELVRESDESLLLPESILDGMLERRAPPRRKAGKGLVDLPNGADTALGGGGNTHGSVHTAPAASPTPPSAALPGSDQPLAPAALEGLATAKRPTARRSRARRAGAEEPAPAIPMANPLAAEEPAPLAEAEEAQQPWGDVRPRAEDGSAGTSRSRRGTRKSKPAPASTPEDGSRSPAQPGEAEGAGEQLARIATEFADDWLSKAAAADLTAIVASRPRIPRGLDAAMLQRAMQTVGGSSIGDAPRRVMRAAFWAAIDAHTES